MSSGDFFWGGLKMEDVSNGHANGEEILHISDEIWEKAEERASEVILYIQPSIKSEQKRNHVVRIIHSLLAQRLGCEVFPFGSVPLKTYLPFGDVDLTTFSNLPVMEDKKEEDKWATNVYTVLKNEESSDSSITDVLLNSNAEVKLVKCTVDNIVVDISFNQIGGLYKVCFLEEIDRLIGQDHLFKRSIILVKAWCFYESRILGALHGLISTYALEILILYIFQLYHTTIRGPLEVLYKFLDYFSKFDWDNYCVSLKGPISKLSKHVEPLDQNGFDLLLKKEKFQECIARYSTNLKVYDIQDGDILKKHLNIADPLKENNNLGRSVNKANFHRIRKAFSLGAKSLIKILMSPEEELIKQLNLFFYNTLIRHASGYRPDVRDSIFCYVENTIGDESASLKLTPMLSAKEKKSSYNGHMSNGTYCRRDGDSLVENNNSLSLTFSEHDSDDVTISKKYYPTTNGCSSSIQFDFNIGISVKGFHALENSCSNSSLSETEDMPFSSVFEALRHLRADLSGNLHLCNNNLDIAKGFKNETITSAPVSFPVYNLQHDGFARHCNSPGTTSLYMPGFKGNYLNGASDYPGASPTFVPVIHNGEKHLNRRSGTGMYFPTLTKTITRTNGNYREKSYNKGRYHEMHNANFIPCASNQKHDCFDSGRNKTFSNHYHEREMDRENMGERAHGMLPNLSFLSVSVSDQSVGSITDITFGHDMPVKSTQNGDLGCQASSHNLSSPDKALLKQVEFGSFGPVQLGTGSIAEKYDKRNQSTTSAPNEQFPNIISETSATSLSNQMKRRLDGFEVNQREESNSYVLKDDEFPPLQFQRQEVKTPTGLENKNDFPPLSIYRQQNGNSHTTGNKRPTRK